MSFALSTRKWINNLSGRRGPRQRISYLPETNTTDPQGEKKNFGPYDPIEVVRRPHVGGDVMGLVVSGMAFPSASKNTREHGMTRSILKTNPRGSMRVDKSDQSFSPGAKGLDEYSMRSRLLDLAYDG